MMTSGQIAGMMGQQNQMFAGAAAYSQQISQQMPGPYGGGMGQSPGGMSQGGFSYGGDQGQNLGSRMGGSAVAAMGGAAQFGMGAVGIAAGFGMMGKMGAPFDPFIGGGAGWRAGGAASKAMGLGRMGSGAMRLGMGAAGMLPAAGVMMGGAHVIGSMMAGAQEQSAVQNVLSRQKMGGAPAGGQSFNRSQASGISDMMRGMQALPEMMTSMGELTRIMDKMGQMGAMGGASNVKEFKDKFKSNIKLLKDMSKVMSSSMEEALPMFGEIKRSGFYSTGDILKNAMSRQIAGGASGLSQGQVNQVAQHGAQRNWGQGGTLKSGAQHSLRTLNQLGAAKSLGMLSEEQISEATGGVGGSEGIAMMAGRMTDLAHKMSRGGLGLATSVAMGEKDEEGRFTGRMDEEKMAKYRAGEYSFKDIKRMANQQKRGGAAIRSWATHKKAMRANMASGMGAEGTVQMLKDAAGARGFDKPDHVRLLAQRFGMSERDTDVYLPLMEKMPELREQMKIQSRDKAKTIARESFMKENYSWGAVKAKAKKRIEGVVTEPFKEMGASISEAINGAVDDFVDDVTGRYKVRVSKEMAGLVQEAMSGVGESKSRLASLYQGAKGAMGAGGMGGMLGGGADLTPGMGGDLMNWMSGNQTAGERMVGNLSMVGGGKYLTRFSGEDREAREQRAGGVNILSRDHKYWGRDDTFAGATNEQLRGARADLMSLSRGGGTDLSRQAGAMMGMDMNAYNVFGSGGKTGETIGAAAQRDLASMLTNNMNLANMSGGERLKEMDKQMKDSTAYQMLKGAMGKGAEADIFGALEAASGGKLGTGMGAMFGQMGTGMSSFRDIAGVSKMREETDAKIREKLGGDLGEDFLALREESVKDKSMDLVFGGILGGTEDLYTTADRAGGYGASRVSIDKATRAKALGKGIGYNKWEVEGIGEDKTVVETGSQGYQYVVDKKKWEQSEAITKAMRGLSEEDMSFLGGGKEFHGTSGMKGLLSSYAAKEAADSDAAAKFSPAVKELIAQQGDSYKTLLGQQHSQSILRKLAENGEVSDKEKRFLKKSGIDVSGLKGKEGQKKAKKMLALMGQLEKAGLKDPKTLAMLKKSRDLSVMGSIAGIAAQFKESGDTLGGAVGGLIESGGMSDEAQALLGDKGAFSRAASLMSSDEAADFEQAAGMVEGKDSASQLIAEGAIGLAALSDEKEASRIASQLGGDTQAAYARARRLKGRAGETIGELLPGFDALSSAEKKAVYDIAAPEGSGEKRDIKATVSKEEFAEFEKLLVAGTASKGIVSAEEREASKFANPAEIARAMADFASSTASLAGVVSTMTPADGKKDAGKGNDG